MDLCEALQQQAPGHGNLVVEITFHDGLPEKMDVRERLPHYRFGKTQPPLTGRGPLARLSTTE